MLEKVITVTLMRSDANLKLPVVGDEIQDALYRARITGDQSHQVMDFFNMLEVELSNP